MSKEFIKSTVTIFYCLLKHSVRIATDDDVRIVFLKQSEDIETDFFSSGEIRLHDATDS